MINWTSCYIEPKKYISMMVYNTLACIVVTKLICSDTNYCVHNPGYHTYYTNSWEIQRSPPTTSSTSWDRLSQAHKMNIKRYKKKNTQFKVVHQIWLTFTGRELQRALLINLTQKDLTFLLMTQEYSSSPWIYAILQEYIFSLCSFTLLLSFLAC